VEDLFAEPMKGVPRSFIREILKASLDPEMISFAGGLPNPAFFPAKEIEQAGRQVFEKLGADVLQYSNSEGDPQLREYISNRYKSHHGLSISPENIIITNGAQQGIDLIGKTFLNSGDEVLIEKPGYLGAIQALSLYNITFIPVPVDEGGMDVAALEQASAGRHAKLLHLVPTFQNPSGVTYPDENRQQVAAVAEKNRFIVIEDDPYSELRFSGRAAKSFGQFLPEQTVLLGSFSKVVAPGLRLGWIAAPGWVHEKLIVAKQAADLHTCGLTQKLVGEFLLEHDLDQRIALITKAYGEQCRAMLDALKRYIPEYISFTEPEGGMFIWGRLPESMKSLDLFQEAVKEKVVFVPGEPFYTGDAATSTFRLNFTCADPATIERGVRRLAKAVSRFVKS